MDATAAIFADLRVRMRDGVHLSTDVYLPADHAPGRSYPVLVERTPYDKRGTNAGDFSRADPIPLAKPAIARRFAAAGYACVLQDTRGRYGSDGVFAKYVNEAKDGVDTLAWIDAQPWCDGRIGTLGLSYGAHVQAATACLDPPSLGAMFLDSGGFSSAYHSGARQGGAFELKQLTWARKHALLAPETARDPVRRAALEAADIGEWIGRRWSRGHSPLAAAPEYEAYVLEQWDNDRFTAFWRQCGLYARGWYREFSDVPMVHMSSWFDPYAQTAIDNFTGLRAIKRGPVKLLLGPWTHGRRSVSWAGDVDFGAAAPLDGNIAVDYFTLRRDWFDRHLCGGKTPDPLPSPVTLFVMGGGSGRQNAAGRLDHGGRWRTEDSWPPADMQPTAWFLHADGSLAPDPPTGEHPPLCYSVDPRDPVPTLGGAIASGAPVMQAGAFDQAATAARRDVLVFQTDRLERDVELTGVTEAHLRVASSALDTDFAIKLLDVYPPGDDYPEGFAMNLAHGILRMRFRDSFEEPMPMEPGRVYAIRIATFPTSNLFVRGHRIRIEVSSSNFPHFDINPNVDWRQADQFPQIAINSVFVDRDNASCVVLPVVPPRPAVPA